MAKRMFDNLIPYTNVHEMNLDWIIEKVEEYMIKYDELEKFVNSSIEEQKEYIEKILNEFRTELKDFEEQMDSFMNYISENIQQITNTIINEMIQQGTIHVAINYNETNEELNIVVSETQGG